MTQGIFDNVETELIDVPPDAQFLEPEAPTGAIFDIPEDKPDPDFTKEKKRPRGAIKYENTVKGWFQTAFAAALGNPKTHADAAAIVMHAPKICPKVGDLAASDPKVARGIDFLSEGTENPYLACLAVSLPFVFQILRNHEEDLEVKQRGIRIPFTKRRFGFKFGIKLGPLRDAPGTKEPDFLKQHVFNDPNFRDKLKKNLGVEFADPA